MQCAVTAQTITMCHLWLCPHLPTPLSTEPANPDGLQFAFQLSLSNSVALFPDSGHQSTSTSVCVFAMSLLQQTLLPFTSHPIHQLSLSQVCNKFTETYTSFLYVKYVQTFTQPYIHYLFAKLASASTNVNFYQ
jgi:hypothetical protein